VVEKRIWDRCSLNGPTKPFSATFVGTLGSSHDQTRTTIRRDMCCPRLDQVGYLLEGLRYRLSYIGELHHTSHWPSAMCRFMMLYHMQCSIWIIRFSHYSHSGRVSGQFPESTSGERSGWTCGSTPFMTVYAPSTGIAVKTVLYSIVIHLCSGIPRATSQSGCERRVS
jgi:hypothetical protein